MGNKQTRAYRVANPEFNRAIHGLGSSNTTQPHVPRPRKGTRTERERQEIRYQCREAGE